MKQVGDLDYRSEQRAGAKSDGALTCEVPVRLSAHAGALLSLIKSSSTKMPTMSAHICLYIYACIYANIYEIGPK